MDIEILLNFNYEHLKNYLLNSSVDERKKVLSDDFSFLLISCYTTGISHISLENILKQNFPNCKIETGENCLPIIENNLILPCGIYGKITKN